ncbi:MAG TPA: hypothetical protein VHC69_13650 [Polyangiaceae bacterium]|nr:hypothetical protein [Polyangiaceae bacterium]
MPPAISKKRARAPRERRLREGGCFFPGEAVRSAGIKGLNYRQLRRLFRIVAGGEPEPGCWARFSFRDLVALRVAYRLAAGKQTQHQHRRLHFAEVEEACTVLRDKYGIKDPLSEVRLDWEDGVIVAQLDGVHFQADTGQLLLVADSVASGASKVAALNRRDGALLKAGVRQDLAVFRARRGQTAKDCLSSPVTAKIRLRRSR